MIDKIKILSNICYTDLVYKRINKKLKTNFSKKQIEDYVFRILNEIEVKYFLKIGKNFYIINIEYKIKITINSSTFRIITLDRI